MRAEDIHIGQLVKTTVREKRIKDVEFARMIGRSKQNVYDMYKRSDMEVKLLLTCSKVLQHNFFEDIYPSQRQRDDEAIDRVFDTLKAIVKSSTHSY